MKILNAKKDVLAILDKMTISDKLYQGKIDITEHINFGEIAENHDLSQKEYDELINDSQDLVDYAVKDYLKIK
jgi:hypothetical protein